MGQCPITHQNDETRSRCHNAECRRLAREQEWGARRSRPGMSVPPLLSRNQRVIPDANGDPIVIDMDNPVIRGRTVGPEAVALLAGVRLERCTLRPGEYQLLDATLTKCKSSPDSTVLLDGASQISDSTMGGPVLLGGETHSSGNTYHGPVTLAGLSSLRQDYLAQGYQVAENANPVVERHSVTIGTPSGAQQPTRSKQSPKRSAGKGKSLARRALSNVATSMVYSLLGRGRRRSGRRRGYRR